MEKRLRTNITRNTKPKSVYVYCEPMVETDRDDF